MSKPQIPAVDGWFTLDPASPDASGIALTGTRCVDSGTYFFPPERVMSRAPGFADSELIEVELSTTGTLWSYTDAQYQPPEPFIAPTDPYEPFCLAAVELAEEQLVVLGQVVSGVGVDDLKVGMSMRLVPGVLFTDDDGDHMMWKWQPADAADTTTPSTNGASL